MQADPRLKVKQALEATDGVCEHISKNDFRIFLTKLGMDSKSVDILMQGVDCDEGTQLPFDVFLDWIFEDRRPELVCEEAKAPKDRGPSLEGDADTAEVNSRCQAFRQLCRRIHEDIFAHASDWERKKETMMVIVKCIFNTVIRDDLTEGKKATGRCSLWYYGAEEEQLGTRVCCFGNTTPGAEGEVIDNADALEFCKYPGFWMKLKAGGFTANKARNINADELPNMGGWDQRIYVPVRRSGKVIAVIGVGGNGTNFSEWDTRFVESCSNILTQLLVPDPRLSMNDAVTSGSEVGRSPSPACEVACPDSFTLDWMTYKRLEEETQAILIEGHASLQKLGDENVHLALWQYGEGRLVLMNTHDPSCSLSKAIVLEDNPILVDQLAREDAIELLWHPTAGRCAVDENLYRFIRPSDTKDFVANHEPMDFKAFGERLKLVFEELGCKGVVLLLPIRVVAMLGLTYVISVSFSGGQDSIQSFEQRVRLAYCGHQMVQAVVMAHSLAKIQKGKLVTPDLRHLIKQINAGCAVALVGAGFSVPAKLPNWADLLKLIVRDGKERSKLNAALVTYIMNKIEVGTAEAFDEAAQILEDQLGAKVMEDCLKTHLKFPATGMPRAMQRRIRWLLGIPFCAILTTNYDKSLSGPTPACGDVEKTYAQVLRSDMFEVDKLQRLIKDDCKPPVVKLHGCVDRGHIVFTREGYRNLLYKSAGYGLFLKSVFSGKTVISLGHSGADGYINDFRSEVMSVVKDEEGSAKSIKPLAYNLMPEDSEENIEFRRAHDGMQILPWDVKKESWDGFDRILEELYMATNPRMVLGRLLVGRSLLVVEPEGVKAYGNGVFWSLTQLWGLLQLCQPSITMVSTRTVEETLRVTKELAQVGGENGIDLILALYDEHTADLLERNRRSDFFVPIAIVSSNKYSNARRIMNAWNAGGVICLNSLRETLQYLDSFFVQMADALNSQINEEEPGA